MDPYTLTAVASSAVTVLTRLLKIAVEEGAKEFGKYSANSLVNKLKKRLTHEGTQKALDDLAKQPDATGAQVELNMQLCKALEADPTLATFLKKWEVKSLSINGHTQTARAKGKHNKQTQMIGDGNSSS